MKKYAEIEEFEYSPIRRIFNKDKIVLYKAKIISEYSIFGKKFTKDFIIPFVFTDKEVAKNFLQYNITYNIANFYFGGYGSIAYCDHVIPFFKLKINGNECYAILYQDNTYMSDNKITYHNNTYNEVIYNDGLYIFKSLMIFPEETKTNNIETWNDNVNHCDVKPLYDNRTGIKMEFKDVDEFLNFKNGIYKSIKTINTTKFELVTI